MSETRKPTEEFISARTDRNPKLQVRTSDVTGEKFTFFIQAEAGTIPSACKELFIFSVKMNGIDKYNSIKIEFKYIYYVHVCLFTSLTDNS